MIVRYRHDSVNILTRIGELKTNWPVAERYFGSSPGFRKVHTRLADASEAYALTLYTVDFPTKLNDWLDKSQGTAVDIKAIKGSDFALGKGEVARNSLLISRPHRRPCWIRTKHKALTTHTKRIIIIPSIRNYFYIEIFLTHHLKKFKDVLLK